MNMRKTYEKSATSITRSSSAEYLTFVAANREGGVQTRVMPQRGACLWTGEGGRIGGRLLSD